LLNLISLWIIGGCAFSCRYFSPRAAPTAILTHCIQLSTGPDWAPFTPFLPADHPILFLSDQKHWGQKARLKKNNWCKLMILQRLLDQSRLLRPALQLDLLYQPKANCLASCVTYIGCLNFSHTIADIRGFITHNQKM